MYASRTVSRLGATSAVDCLSEYAQISDGSFYLPLSSAEGVTVSPNITSFGACVDLCSQAACQLVTYEYVNQLCSVRVSQAPLLEG